MHALIISIALVLAQPDVDLQPDIASGTKVAIQYNKPLCVFLGVTPIRGDWVSVWVNAKLKKGDPEIIVSIPDGDGGLRFRGWAHDRETIEALTKNYPGKKR